MQLPSALLGVTRDARGWLDHWSRGFDEAEARATSGAPVNPVAWQLGHVAATQADVVALFGGPADIVPEAIRAVCGTGCPAPTPDTRYPSLAELRTLLDRTLAALCTMVEQCPAGEFDRPPLQSNRFFTSFGQAVYEIALHETYHVGQVAALRKALGKE